MSENVDEPKVYCETQKEKVPIWYCTGSFTKKRKMCSRLIEITYVASENLATVKCKR